jgi:hypothetical protein
MVSIKLDWSRLLGYDPAPRTSADSAAIRVQEPQRATLGAKFGSKLRHIPSFLPHAPRNSHCAFLGKVFLIDYSQTHPVSGAAR